jgi:hypothetical protein
MINLNKTVFGLDGKEIEGTNIGKIVAQALVQSSRGDALKFWHWATKMHEGSTLDLDPTDTETLKTFIKDNDNLTILLKAQALACFEK